MTARRWFLARFPGESRAHYVNPVCRQEAEEHGELWAEVIAFTYAHARRLWLEGVQSITDCEGRYTTCGIVAEHNPDRY